MKNGQIRVTTNRTDERTYIQTDRTIEINRALVDPTTVLRIRIFNTTVGSIASSFKTITTTMADVQPQTQGLLSTSTSTLETDVNNLLENIVNVYKYVDPRLVAIKLDKFVSGLPYSFSNIQFCASRTPNYSTFYDFQCFLKATTAAESSSSFETDKPDTVSFSSSGNNQNDTSQSVPRSKPPQFITGSDPITTTLGDSRSRVQR